MLAYEHGYHHSRSDALVAARAALWQAIGGRDEPVLDYVRRYLPEWLRERRPDLVTPDRIARWQRVVDLFVVAGDTRVADLAD